MFPISPPSQLCEALCWLQLKWWRVQSDSFGIVRVSIRLLKTGEMGHCGGSEVWLAGNKGKSSALLRRAAALCNSCNFWMAFNGSPKEDVPRKVCQRNQYRKIWLAGWGCAGGDASNWPSEKKGEHPCPLLLFRVSLIFILKLSWDNVCS